MVSRRLVVKEETEDKKEKPDAEGLYYEDRVRLRKQCVYAVECLDGCYYIGTTKDFNRRKDEHSGGTGSHFVKQHGFKSMQSITKWGIEPETETYFTMHYMRIYGVEKVRGGPWCQVDFSPLELKELKRIVGHNKGVYSEGYCYKCEGLGHYSGECRSQPSDDLVRERTRAMEMEEAKWRSETRMRLEKRMQTDIQERMLRDDKRKLAELKEKIAVETRRRQEEKEASVLRETCLQKAREREQEAAVRRGRALSGKTVDHSLVTTMHEHKRRDSSKEVCCWICWQRCVDETTNEAKYFSLTGTFNVAAVSTLRQSYCGRFQRAVDELHETRNFPIEVCIKCFSEAKSRKEGRGLVYIIWEERDGSYELFTIAVVEKVVRPSNIEKKVIVEEEDKEYPPILSPLAESTGVCLVSTNSPMNTVKQLKEKMRDPIDSDRDLYGITNCCVCGTPCPEMSVVWRHYELKGRFDVKTRERFRQGESENSKETGNDLLCVCIGCARPCLTESRSLREIKWLEGETYTVVEAVYKTSHI